MYSEFGKIVGGRHHRPAKTAADIHVNGFETQITIFQKIFFYLYIFEL